MFGIGIGLNGIDLNETGMSKVVEAKVEEQEEEVEVEVEVETRWWLCM